MSLTEIFFVRNILRFVTDNFLLHSNCKLQSLEHHDRYASRRNNWLIYVPRFFSFSDRPTDEITQARNPSGNRFSKRTLRFCPQGNSLLLTLNSQ